MPSLKAQLVPYYLGHIATPMDSHELPGLATEKWSIVTLSRQSWRWLIGKSALGRPALAIFKKLKKRPGRQCGLRMRHRQKKDEQCLYQCYSGGLEKACDTAIVSSISRNYYVG